MMPSGDDVRVRIWCGGYVECARSFDALCTLHRFARERDNATRELEAVDGELLWKGTGRGRVEEIRRLKAALEGDEA